MLPLVSGEHRFKTTSLLQELFLGGDDQIFLVLISKLATEPAIVINI
jgi:hypothetical protein